MPDTRFWITLSCLAFLSLAPAVTAWSGSDEDDEDVVAVEEAPEKAAAVHPPFETEPRIDVLEEHGNYPCTDCHDGTTQKSNPKIRELVEEHDDLKLDHGDGQFWCLTCHMSESRDTLVSMKGAPINFDQSYRLCAQCHAPRAKDFYFGGHGKRVGNWSGERLIKGCVECHNPHSPSIKPRMPVGLPKLRPGIAVPVRHNHEQEEKPWDKIRDSRGWEATK